MRKKHKHMPQGMDASEASRLEPKRYSSWRKLVRVTAWTKRFIKNCKSSLESRNLSTTLNEMELDEARTFWFRRVQAESFPGGQNDQCLIRFTPKLDKDGILRVDGRP